jgi:hypothetical protein
MAPRPNEEEIIGLQVRFYEACAPIEPVINGERIFLKTWHHFSGIFVLIKPIAEAEILSYAAQHVITMRKVGLGHIALAVMAHGAAVESFFHNIGCPRQGKLQAISGIDSKAVKLAPTALKGR